MYKNIELINTIKHKDVIVKDVNDLSFASKLISSPITVREFFEACKDYPIVFAKDANNEWLATVMLGFKENENLFIDKETNKWTNKKYIPASIRRYPFIFVNNPQSPNELSLGIESEFLVEANEKNNDKTNNKKLFINDNKEQTTNSEFLNNVLAFLNEFQNDAIATTQFIKQLDELGVLEEKTATVKTKNNEAYNINGMFVVNEDKLKHLSKKKQDDMCSKNAIPLITAHLISLSNIARLG